MRLALALKARGRRARIINADSSQVYADLRVLSARPTEEEMCGIPHRLFGERDGSLVYSAAEWARTARNIIYGCTRHGTVPIVVGGTGLYIMTLVEGIAPVPRVDPAVRAAVRALSTEEAYRALQAEDFHYARRLHPNDTARVCRALEVVRSTGTSLACWQSFRRNYRIGDTVDIHPAVLLPDRDTLYRRIDRRFSQMVANGAIEEVRALRARGLDPALPVTRAIGVREIGAFLEGRVSLADAMIDGAQATRNYAKRQFTWLRHKTPAEWPRWETDYFDPESQFASLLRKTSLT